MVRVLQSFLISVVVVLESLVICTASFKAKLTILHFNDINSQIGTFDKSDPSKFANYGGLASLVSLLEKEENDTKNANVFRIAAGNLIGGENGWLSLAGWEEFGHIVHEFYKPGIMGLGHKEFEGGLGKLNEYAANASTKALINNVNCAASFPAASMEKEFCQNHTILTAQLLDVRSEDGNDTLKVGVLGFVNPIVERLADPGKLSFEDPATALARTVAAFPDINTFIAVGGGSMKIAQDILNKVDKIKVVVLAGGSEEMTPDKYPVKEGNGYIVKAGHFGTTFGKLVLEIVSETGATTVAADTKLIENNSSQPDPIAHKHVKDIEERIIEKAVEDQPGHTLVKLNATRENCWRMECNLGNLIADAMVHCALRNLSEPKAATTIGVWPSGSMFDSIVEPGNPISKLDIHKWLPYHNQAYFVTVAGSTLKRMFNSAGGAIVIPVNGERYWGQFLQVSSGIQVKYSSKGEVTSLCAYQMNDSQPILENVSDGEHYNLVIPSFMYSGRSVYDYLPGLFVGVPDMRDIGSDDDCLYEYIKGVHILTVGFEQRITIGDGGDGGGGDCPKCNGANTGVTVVLTLFIFVLIVGCIYVGWRFVWPRIASRGHTSSFP